MIKINPEVTIGNILTTISILFGVATFVSNESHKRRQVDRAYAAEVRNEIGQALREAAQLDNELKLLFLSVEPFYVTASQLALRETSDNGATGSEHARDRLWQEVALARADMERRVLEVDAQYSGLSLVGVDIQSKYTQFRNEHAQLRLAAFASLSEASQAALQSTAHNASFTAEIGNALRVAHYEVEKKFVEQSINARAEISQLLLKAAAEIGD